MLFRSRPLGLLGWFCFPKFPPGFKPPLCSRFSWVFNGSLSSAGRFSLFLSLFIFSFLRVPLLFFSFSSPFFFGFFSIYRGKVRGPLVVGSGFRGWMNHPRHPGVVSLLSAGGRPMTSVGGPTVWGLGLFGGDVGERERREVFSKFFVFCCC